MPKQVSFKEKITLKLATSSRYIYLILSLLLVFSLVRNIGRTIQIKKTIQEERQNLTLLYQQKEDLIKKLAVSQSQEFLEEQLRNKLGLSKEGEIVIVLPDEETLRKIAPVLPQESEILPPPTWKKWLKLFI